MTILTYITTFFQVITLALYLHPIHVSVTEIKFDEQEKELEIMIRVFIDDLELTLREDLHQPELDILQPKNGLTTDQMVGNYLEKHFKISLDNKAQKTVYLGHEREAEALIFYVEVSDVKKWSTIRIFNDIFMEKYHDESNLVHVTVGEKVRSLRLTRDIPEDKLTFDTK